MGGATAAYKRMASLSLAPLPRGFSFGSALARAKASSILMPMSGVCDHASNEDAHDANCHRDDDDIGLGHGMLPVAGCPIDAQIVLAHFRPGGLRSSVQLSQKGSAKKPGQRRTLQGCTRWQ